MDTILKAKCDLLAENKLMLNKSFGWDSDYMRFAAAGMLTCSGVTPDEEKLKYLEKLLKEQTGIFSDLRGFVKLPLVCKMLASNNPEYYLDKVQDIYKELSSGIFGKSEYKVVAAIIIADSNLNVANIMDRTVEIYKRMTKNHSFLTSNEDYPLCAALAVSGKNVDRLIEDMEESYSILKKKFGDLNAVQTLSHVLSLDSKAPEVKCQRVIDIWDQLKKSRHKYGTGMEIGNLGVLQALDYEVDEIVNKMIEADDYLKTKPGFKGILVSGDLRRLFASQVVLDTMAGENVDSLDESLSTMLASAIEMQVIMMICIMSAISAQNAATANC